MDMELRYISERQESAMSGDVSLELAYRQEGLQELFDVFTETFFGHNEHLSAVNSFFTPKQGMTKGSKNCASLSGLLCIY